MTLKETKIYFETLFYNDWIDTPIHYAGEEFDGSPHEKWVNPVYQPLRSTSNGVSKTTNISINALYVVCWANTDLDAMGLADDIITFIENNVDKTLLRKRGHEVIDHGWGDSNKVFIVLSFTFEQFDGAC